MNVRRWVCLGALAGFALTGCRTQPPDSNANAPTTPLSEASAIASDITIDREALASLCRVVKISNGQVGNSQKATFALPNAGDYQGSIADSSIAVVRDTPDIDYQFVGQVANLNDWPPQKDTDPTSDTELVLCLYETNDPEDAQTCWYLNEEGWYGGLTVYGTRSQLYLVEANTVDLVAQTNLTRSRPECPESYTLKGDNRSEIQNGLPIQLQRVKTWLQTL
ncbi:hypothetical protein [Baaleninema sp.]|uniref:hypothetical protein n=1 Tax=Baaleninema sp. TaxID=3101197 RepID=UPI003CFC198D